MASTLIKKVKWILIQTIYSPIAIAFVFSKEKKTIAYDIKRWLQVYDLKTDLLGGLAYLFYKFPEFRNVFYHRIGFIRHFLQIIYPKLSSLYITTSSIGKGLFIQHGFATIIAAKSIGNDCWINQQVTIGFSNKNDCPVIGNHVTIHAGAKVIGGISIGNHVVIGANAVVVKNVPDHCVVVGVPAYIIKKEGVKTNIPL
jgi:serine O-acetyltransferase